MKLRDLLLRAKHQYSQSREEANDISNYKHVNILGILICFFFSLYTRALSFYFTALSLTNPLLVKAI